MPRPHDDAPVNLGDAIEGERKRREMTQSDVADEIGAAQSQLSRWIDGRSAPNPANVARLADFLRMPEEEVALLVHRSRRRSTSERLADVERRLSDLEDGLAEIRKLVARRGSNR